MPRKIPVNVFFILRIIGWVKRTIVSGHKSHRLATQNPEMGQVFFNFSPVPASGSPASLPPTLLDCGAYGTSR
jgi:hypothetical protein